MKIAIVFYARVRTNDVMFIVGLQEDSHGKGL